MTTTTTPPTEGGTDTTIEESRHAAGLAVVAQVLTQPEPYKAILKAQQDGRVDEEMADLARHLTKPDHCTTAQLQMSRHSALSIMFQLGLCYTERWGDDHQLTILEDGYAEDDYGRLQDHLQAMADMAGALSSDAAHACRSGEPEQENAQ